MRLNGSKFCLLAVGLVCAGAARAEDLKPTVAPAPLELRRKPTAISTKEEAALLEEFDRRVRTVGARAPTPSEMATALAELEGVEFASSDEALAQLAQKAQAFYAVHLLIDYPVTGSVVGVARVVRSDGKRIGEEVRVVTLRDRRTYLQATTDTVIAVLEKLDLQSLPSAPQPVAEAATPVDAPIVGKPTEAPPVLAPPPERAAPPRVVEEASSSPRYAGGVICIAGAALIIAGLISLGLASRDAARLTPDERHYLPQEQASLYQAAKSKELVGGVLLGVGAAAGLGGGALWLAARKGPSVELTVAPSPGGAVARLGGVF